MLPHHKTHKTIIRRRTDGSSILFLILHQFSLVRSNLFTAYFPESLNLLPCTRARPLSTPIAQNVITEKFSLPSSDATQRKICWASIETETIPLIEQCQFPTDRPTDELHLKIFRKMLGPSTWRNFLRLASFWPRSELLERYRPTPVLFSSLSRPDSAASRNRTAAHNVPHIYKTQLQLLLSVLSARRRRRFTQSATQPAKTTLGYKIK